MAEAAIDKQTNALPLKYFCHQCSESVEIKASADVTNLTCPTCESSFIEELTQELENDRLHSSRISEQHRDPLFFLRGSNSSGLVSNMLLSLGSMNPIEVDDEGDDDDDDDFFQFIHRMPEPLSSSAHSPLTSASATSRSNQQSPFHRFLEQLLGNLRAGSMTSGQSAEFLPGFPPLLQGFLGDPRDYAWGADGIDNIITQLLEQTEGSGPPPATKEDIDSLPSTTITQDYVDRATQCSVCLENFILDETVKGLPCEHIFHCDCVVPWLQLHRTCPICRKPVGGVLSEGEHVIHPPPGDSDGPPNHASSQVSSNSSSSIFQDAFEEADQQETDLLEENLSDTELLRGNLIDTEMQGNNFVDADWELESNSDMEI